MPIQTDFSDFTPSEHSGGQPAAAPQSTQADRDAAQWIEAALRGDNAGAQAKLDEINGREFVDDRVQLPPVGQPGPALEPTVAASYREQLANLNDAGRQLAAEWGDGFGENYSHAMRGLELLREQMPDLSDALDSAPADWQAQISASLLRFASTYNRRYSQGMGERPLQVSGESANTRRPSSSPLQRSAPSGRRASLVPARSDIDAPRDVQKLRTTPEIDRLSREAHRMWERGLGHRDEARELFRQRDELIEQLPGARDPIVGQRGRLY
jgi:hypothetical protein